MAEGEKGWDLGAFVVPVANVDALAVDDGQVLAWPIVVCGCVFEATGECALGEKP